MSRRLSSVGLESWGAALTFLIRLQGSINNLLKCNMIPPKKILVMSDTNIMEWKETIPKGIHNKETLFVYVFIKSVTKMGTLTYFTEDVLSKLLKNTFKTIE